MVGEFHIAPPSGWATVHSAPYNGIALAYADERRLGLTRHTSEDIAIDTEAFRRAGLSMRDYYDMVFQQTVEDSPPSDEAARQVWQQAMDTKRLQFPEAMDAVIVEREVFRIYSAVISLGSFDTRTFVVRHDTPDVVLEILGSGFDQETVIDVAVSTSPREGE